jgi:hypothetical protein
MRGHAGFRACRHSSAASSYRPEDNPYKQRREGSPAGAAHRGRKLYGGFRIEQQTYWEDTVMTTPIIAAAGAAFFIVGIAVYTPFRDSDPFASHRRAVHRAWLTFISSAADARSKEGTAMRCDLVCQCLVWRMMVLGAAAAMFVIFLLVSCL